MSSAISQRLRASRWIIVSAAASVGAFVGWAAWAKVDTLTRAPGHVIASARTQTVQASEGGVLVKLHVREGDPVEKGQLVATLDRARAVAAHSDSEGKVAALRATLARLRAEVFNRPLAFDADLNGFPSFLQNQTELYQRRRQALEQELGALESHRALAQRELDMTEPLLASGDVSEAEVLRLKRQVAEIGAQLTNRRNKYFQDAQAEMTRAEEELATQGQVLAERRALLDHTELYAPESGFVKSIQVTTLGAVVRAGEEVMQILPTGGGLVFEAKVSPADIGFIHAGLPVSVKADAYDYSIYGHLVGSVVYVSPDALTEQSRQGEVAYYRVRIRMEGQSFTGPGAKPIGILPGMTGTAEIRTGAQAVLRYLTKPITKTFGESMSER
jgi:multidrug efflux pump subunit AcrA (membrane-fusion protein)